MNELMTIFMIVIVGYYISRSGLSEDKHVPKIYLIASISAIAMIMFG